MQTLIATHMNNQTPTTEHTHTHTHTSAIQPSSPIKYLLKYEPPVAAFQTDLP